MSAKYAILGVLMQCPGHGYRIKKIFAPFLSGNGLNDGQVYPILTRLEKAGLVRKRVVHQQKSPNKNIYHITERGREEFLNWLTGSDGESDPVKYDFFMQHRFLMKCNFFEHLSRAERIEKLERQIASAREKVAEYERVRENMRERDLSGYKLKIVDFGIETQQLKVRWASELLEEELAGATPEAMPGKRPEQTQDTAATPGKSRQGAAAKKG